MNLTKYIPTDQESMTSEDKERKEEAISYLHFISEKDRHGSLLIIGAGDGIEIDEAKKMGFNEVVGITLTEKEKGDRMDLIICDMHELKFRNKTFDYVYSKETFEHSIAPYVALCEVNRVLKDTGKFLLAIAQGIRKQRDWYHFSCFPEYIWIDLMYKAELEVEYIFKDGREQFYDCLYWGYKKKHKNIKEHIELYSLEDLISLTPIKCLN